MKTLLLFALLAVAVGSRLPAVNQLGRPLVVIAAPSVWDVHYQDRFRDLIEFDIELIRSIRGTDNVLLIADTHTLPYFEGRVSDEILLESNIYDIWLREFAPFCSKDKLYKFRYASKGTDDLFTHVIDASFDRFIADHFVDIAQKSELHLTGCNVVANGQNRAIISDKIFDENAIVFQDWAIRIQLRNIFGDIVFLPDLTNSTFCPNNMTMPLENLMVFIAEDTIVMAEVEEPDRTDILEALKKGFRGKVKTVEMHMHYVPETFNDHLSVCGMHTAMLVTNDNIYMPVYGNDPENWKMGFSSMMDKHNVQMLQVTTNKQVIPVNIPHRICQMGGSPKSLTWQLTGDAADQLINVARMRANIRRAIRKKLDKQQEPRDQLKSR